MVLGTFWRQAAFEGSTLDTVGDQRVAGIFEVSDDDPWRLKLLESLLPSDDPARTDLDAVPSCNVIYGASSDQTRLSLFDAWRRSFSLFSALYDEETWNIGWYAEGSAWVAPEDQVDSITIEYSLLADWGWPYERATRAYDHSNHTFSVPETEEILTAVDDTDIILRFGWHQHIASHRYLARTRASVQIHDALALEDIGEKWVFPLQALLEFLTLRYVDPTIVVAKPTNIDGQVEIHHNIYKPTDLDERSDIGVHPSTMLATRNHLSNCGIGIETLLSNYFKLIDDENHRAALWFLRESANQLMSKTADASLLNAFRALERYHYAAIGGTTIPQNEHETRVAEIVSRSPERYQQWVRGQLTGANTKGLRRQLNEVKTRSIDTVKKITEIWPDFFDSLVGLRSQIAHGIPSARRESGLHHLAAAVGLRWILRHVYLLELGLSDQDASQTIAQCLAFEQELGLLRDWHRQLESD